jgi:hypothetical protein
MVASRRGSPSVLAMTSVQPATASASSMPRRIGGKTGFMMSGISTPMVFERRVRRPAANMSGA